MTPREKFLKEVEDFLVQTGMSPSTFGLEAVNDKAYVTELRRGRASNLDTVEIVRSYMNRVRRRQHRSKAKLIKQAD
jgi:homoserine dehydrogenase